jgi:hypothetical protein
MKRTLAAPFYGACAILVAILPLEWLPSAEPPPVKPAASQRLVTPTDTGTDTKDTGEWADTVLARPLFTVGRRAPKSAGGAHQAANTGLPRLAGIMITMAGKWAIFAPDGGKPLVLKEGAALDDATIRTIQRDRVLVSGPKGDQVLLPTFDHARTGQLTPTTPVFPQPGLNPGFPNPGFNPAFNGRPNFPMPMQPQSQPPLPGGPGDANDDTGDAPNPPPQPQMAQPLQSPFPGQRNPAFPRE